MERVNVETKPKKVNTKELLFILVSWKNKKRIEEQFIMKSHHYVSDLIQKIHTMKPELHGKFIIKCGDIRVGGKHIPISTKIKKIWSFDSVDNPMLKVITPDKYPAARDRVYDENPLYSVEFLLKLGNKEPNNLHKNCIINDIRLGRSLGSNSENNHPANLILLKTPYGTFLANIYSTVHKFLGQELDLEDPLHKVEVSFDINGKKYIVPKPEENATTLNRIIETFHNKPPINRNIELYQLDMIKQESTMTSIMRLFT